MPKRKTPRLKQLPPILNFPQAAFGRLFRFRVSLLRPAVRLGAMPPAIRRAAESFPKNQAARTHRAATLEISVDLITPELRQQLLANGEASRDNPRFDPHPLVKWFNPCGAAAWLITELDPGEEDLAYGLCDLGLGTPEIGVVSVRELYSIRLMGGALGVERDLYWKANKPLSEYARLARLAGRIVD